MQVNQVLLWSDRDGGGEEGARGWGVSAKRAGMCACCVAMGDVGVPPEHVGDFHRKVKAGG